jgi:hypothetical protein
MKPGNGAVVKAVIDGEDLYARDMSGQSILEHAANVYSDEMARLDLRDRVAKRNEWKETVLPLWKATGLGSATFRPVTVERWLAHEIADVDLRVDEMLDDLDLRRCEVPVLRRIYENKRIVEGLCAPYST